MTQNFNVGCLQFCADNDLEVNLKLAEKLTRQSAEAGADLICLPEYFSAIEIDDQSTLKNARLEEQHPVLSQFKVLAKELSVWIQIGSMPIRVNEIQVNNRAFLINSDGKITARYNKIHLFDVMLNKGESYHESDVVMPGTEAVVAKTPWGKLGMSVCYDVRFADQYRAMAKKGADFLTVPAAFTQTTGQAHWHTLLRARAIETGCYVFAASQNGVRHTGRATYGHSLIIDPWGVILADAGEEDGFIIAEIDPAKIQEAREMIPALQHDREYNIRVN
ncbi:MAG: carbon-nitrogen hydrolase family protein [Gammaproteobacteria bacterium]